MKATTSARPTSPAAMPACNESSPKVADTVCTAWGTSSTGSEP